LLRNLKDSSFSLMTHMASGDDPSAVGMLVADGWSPDQAQLEIDHLRGWMVQRALQEQSWHHDDKAVELLGVVGINGEEARARLISERKLMSQRITMGVINFLPGLVVLAASVAGWVFWVDARWILALPAALGAAMLWGASKYLVSCFRLPAYQQLFTEPDTRM
jgi:hypothetical protein